MKKSIVSFIGLITSILESKEACNVTVYENSSQTTFQLDEFINHYNPEDIGKGLCHLIFKIQNNDSLIATFQLNDMFNCSGILVFSEVFVNKPFRNRGLSKAITAFVVDFSKYYGYGMLQAVDQDSNSFQKKSFEKGGWKIVNSFVNPKTANKLNVWFHNLNEI